MTNFYTSDLHIGHRLVAGHRGFLRYDESSTEFGLDPIEHVDVDAHDLSLADYWLSTVKEDDTVFVLGDTGMSKFDYVLEWFAALPGTKHLIAGNHDPVHPARSDSIRLQRKWLEVFATINPYTTRKIAGQKVLLSHFPYASYGDGTTHGEPGEGRWSEWRVDESMGKLLLHGHTHGPEKGHDNMLHVGWDAWGRFVRHDEVEAWVTSRTQ